MHSRSITSSDVLIRQPRLGPIVALIVASIFGIGISLGISLNSKILPVALGFAALVFVIWGRSKGDLLHPVCVFGGLWCACLALASLRLLPSISNWPARVWLCFITPLFSFPAGVWLAWRFSKRRVSAKAKDRGLCLEALPAKRTLLLAAVCLLIGVSVLGYEYQLIGGIPALPDNPDAM